MKMSKITGAMVTSGLMIGGLFAVHAAPNWENEAIFRINKEKPHATKMAFPTAEEAMTKTRMESPWCMLLNGEWDFYWTPTVEKHEEEIPDFYKPDFDASAWGTIPVPSNVELQGYGTPIYRNAGYVFPMNPPSVTDAPDSSLGWTTEEERSPVSAYRKTVTLPESWDGRSTFLMFNAVESAFSLYINGEEVGYSQDSRTPAEFNITKYLKPGENLIAVKVYRYSDGAYLEDQDMWRLSGIFRDVYLWSADTLDLRDFEVHATLNDTYELGELSLTGWISNYGDDAADYTLAGALLDASGNMVSRLSLAGNAFSGKEDVQTNTVKGLDISPWSAESPTLYTLMMCLKDAEGEAVAYYAQKVGFVRREIKGGNLLINGEPILIKGVDRHDHDDIHGHYVPEAIMRAELDLMKQLNINAIRTSHYPNDPRFLELVNEYGFYVISEANVETHGFGNDANNQIANDEDWRPALLDRVQNMVETFKNQPCVFSWSMGNEAGTGPNFEAMANWARERDPMRVVHYEGGCRSDPPYFYVDFESPMYYGIGGLEPWCRRMEQKPVEEQKPMIQCEYSHAMGNSCGGLYEYWELYRNERLLQGGFIWDWRDQGIRQTKPASEAPVAVAALDPDRFTNEDGSLTYFAYGGDFGDNPNDNNFCMNGVVGADLVPNPHAVEVAYQYRSILTTCVDASAAKPTLKVFNENFFVPLVNQPLKWTLLKDGKPVQAGETVIKKLDPQDTCKVTVPLDKGSVSEKTEYALNVEYPVVGSPAWAPEGHVAARDQILLEWTSPKAQAYQSSSDAAVSCKEAGDALVFSVGDVSISVDPVTGRVVSYTKGDLEYLKQPLGMNFWRAPTDNDRGASVVGRCAPWRNAGVDAKVTNKSNMTKKGAAAAYEVKFDYSVPVGETKAAVTYTIFGDGALGVTLSISPRGQDLPELPRLGFQCAIDPAFADWTWYGRGPEENYSDRNAGTFLGLWKGDVHTTWFPYAEPQGTANRTGVRKASFSDGEHGLQIASTDGQSLEIEAYPFLQSDLEGPHHPADIPLRDLITVSIDHRQMGVGGENSWGAWPRAQHRIVAGGTYEYSFVLRPF